MAQRSQIIWLFLVLIAAIVIASLAWLGFSTVNQALPETTTTTLRPQSYNFKSFPVLEYHHIRRPEARWSRTPENFRQDLEWLYDHDYYPMNLRYILTRFEGLPEGKTPVVLTFDDSPSNQFRYISDAAIDPECAVGILKSFHEQHPDEWPLRATFFVLVQTNSPDHNLFGQADYAERKLQELTEWGMEIGSHCYSHEKLNKISLDAARFTLARSTYTLKALSGQGIVSLATPMGLYPTDESVFQGSYQSLDYDYKLVCEVAGGLQPVPGSAKFDPHHIRRIQTIDSEWAKFFNRNSSAQ
ncbi:MAG: polysaccharide deacetylase family protein [Candidatus Margulisbacteria bacterium]|nr:polysaccharide deacetylase family protein [Candidatus Margulisiibacteriota bacterium]